MKWKFTLYTDSYAIKMLQAGLMNYGLNVEGWPGYLNHLSKDGY